MRKNNNHTTAYKDESRLFYIALSVFFIVFCAYMYFVSASIAHVVMRKEIDSQIASVGTSVSQLEAQYIEMQHSVSSDIASLQGFVKVDKEVFIDRTEDTLVLLQN